MTDRPAYSSRWHAAALAAALAAAWTLAAVGVPRVRALAAEVAAWRSDRARAQALTGGDARSDAAARARALRARLATLTGRLPRVDRPSEHLEVLRRLAGRAGVTLLLVRPAVPERRDGYTEAPCELELHGSYDGVGRFVSALEQSPLLLRVERLAIRAPPEPPAPPDTLLRAALAVRFVTLHPSPP